MSKIKSALELAMEKTANVEADRGAVHRAEAAKEAKKQAARFLSGEDCPLALEGNDEKEHFRSVLIETLLLNLKLPRVNEELAGLTRLEEGFSRLMDTPDKQEMLTSLFGQLKNFFAQYLDSKEQLMESLAAQLEPQLRRKEAQLREQTGQDIRLRPEQDPEFMNILQNQQAAMDGQYNEVVRQAKDQLKELL